MERALPWAALAAVLMVTGPLLVGEGVDLPDDALYYGVASWEWLRTAVQADVAPWWVPGKLGGVSLFSDVVPQGPFYPGVWLTLLMPSVPAMGLAAVLHAIGTLLAVRWLARLHGIRRELAWLAGAGVAAGPLAVWAAIDFQVDAWPTFLWFPVVLGCLRCSAEARAVQDRRTWLRWIALGGIATALLLLGSHLRLAIAAGAALALWSLVRSRDLPGAALTGGLGLLGGMPAILPMLMEYRIQGAGGGPSSLGTQPDLALGLWNAAGWLTPKVMLYDRDLGVGALLGAGAIIAVCALLRAEPEWRRLAVFTGLLLLAGTRIPGARHLLAPITLLTHPVNLVYPALALIPASILGAAGLEWLLEQRRLRERDRRVVLGVLAGLFLFSLLRLALGTWTFPSTYSQGLYALAVVQVSVVAGVSLRWLRQGNAPVGALVLLGIADLALFGLRAHLAVPSAPLRATGEVRGNRLIAAEGLLDIEDLATGFEAPRALGSDEDDDGEGPTRRRAERDQANEEEVVAYETEAPKVQERLLRRVWPVHAGMALHVPGVSGRSKMMPRRTSALLAPVAEELADVDGDPDVVAHLFAPEGRGWRLLEIFGVRTAVWDDRVVARLDKSVGPCVMHGLEPRVEPDEDRRVASLLDRAASRGSGVIEAPLPPGDRFGPAQMFCDHTTGEIAQKVSVGPGTRSLVGVRRPLHPGWVVRAKGETLTPIAIDQVHQGVLLGAGQAELRWRFEPPGLRRAILAGVVGWLLMMGLLLAGRPARLTAGTLAVALLALPGIATAVEGRLVGAEDGVSYEVLLTTSLDLGDTATVWGRAILSRDAPDFVLPDLSEDSWAFLRQEIPREGLPPLVFYRPADLLPLDGSPIVLRAVPRDLALLRDSGEPAPRWWLPPALLAAVVFLGFPLLRRRLTRDVRGARIAPEQAAPLPPLPTGTRPWDRRVLVGVLALAAGMRIPGLGGSLDLLEWSYGPGTARVLDEEVGALPRLLGALIDPPSLELVHPPLWHWLSQSIDALLPGAEWALRTPSFVLSVGTCAVLFTLLRPLSSRAASLAALGYAVAPPAVHFGRDATPYAAMGFLCVLSIVLVRRALSQGTRGSWAVWLAVLGVAFLCHYGAVFFAVPQAVALLWLLVRSRDSRPWRLAAAQALGVAPGVLALPVAWTFLHFRNFATTALDTRLYADTYPPDPGFARFAGEFGSVGLGMPPALWVGAVALVVPAVLGLRSLSRQDRALGLLLALLVAGFLGGIGFFYTNLVGELGGRVFWGFRWVAWFLPVGLAAAAMGTTPSSSDQGARFAQPLAAIWLVGTLAAPWADGSRSTRPDYAGAAAYISERFEDRDGLAALPLWGQRGPVRTYLSRNLTGRFGTIHGTTAWDFEGRAGYLEMIDERLPFETSIRNGHVDRVWVVQADERMFGREKFRTAISDRAVAFAEAEMELLERVELDHLVLSLFKRRDLMLSDPLKMTELGSARFLEPNTPPCSDDEDPTWRGVVRGRLPLGGARPTVEGGTVHPIDSGDGTQGLFTAEIRGGSCSSNPPTLEFGSLETRR